MVTGWRRAFCTSIHRDRDSVTTKEKQELSNNNPNPSPSPSPRLGKFSFFSNPSTPRLQTQPEPISSSPTLRCRTTATATIPTQSVPESPKLQCKIKNSPKLFHRSSPSSPRSPSTFSLLKSTLRFSKQSRCGICLHSVKTGQGTAIFTAECSHSFHFPCISSHMKKQGSLVCPVCSCSWKEEPLLAVQTPRKVEDQKREQLAASIDLKTKQYARSVLKVYNDDEPLMSPASGALFNPIPESDENGDEDDNVEEFQGFFVNGRASPVIEPAVNCKNVEVKLLPEAAVVSVRRSYETYAIVLKVRSPPVPENMARRAPIDLVTVLDVSGGMTVEKIQMMKRAMRLVLSSLSSADRLSIVAFSATSKRLLPLKRMTLNGRLSARRIVDALVAGQGSSSFTDALKKAAKVIEDRRERNPVASIMLLSDVHDGPHVTAEMRQSTVVTSTRYSHLEIPVHTVGISHGSAYGDASSGDAFAKCVCGLLSVAVQDFRLQLGFVSGSAPAEIAAVYSHTCRPGVLGSGSIRLGDLYAEEERELLIELKVPSSAIGAHHVLSVRCCYRDPSTQKIICTKDHALLVPRPHAVRSSSPNIERLRNLFVTTRAVAESRRLLDRNDLTGAQTMLSSARALLFQASSASAADFIRALEAELSEIHRRLQIDRRRTNHTTEREVTLVDEKGEPLTPTSAWRAAERLAKLAIMRKSLNRVSDLHGFENARF